MPMKEMHLKRWQVVTAFVAVVVAATVMGIFLKQAIDDNHAALRRVQASRVESCLRTYKVLNSLIDASIASTAHDRPNHQLTPTELERIQKFRKLLDPGQCKEITSVNLGGE
jgi:hypothetical protein